MTAKLRRVTLEELSIAEVLFYMQNPFCDMKMNFLKFGKNLRGAWELLLDDENNYEIVTKHIGLEFLGGAHHEMMEVGLKWLDKKDATETDLRQKLREIPRSWFLMTDWSKEDKEKEWEVFRKALFEFLKKKMKDNPSWGVMLIQNKKALQKKAKVSKRKR